VNSVAVAVAVPVAVRPKAVLATLDRLDGALCQRGLLGHRNASAFRRIRSVTVPIPVPVSTGVGGGAFGVRLGLGRLGCRAVLAG